MAVVVPEKLLKRIVVTHQRCHVAGLARASCGAATCNAKTVDVARWMHAAPPKESVETLREYLSTDMILSTVAGSPK